MIQLDKKQIQQIHRWLEGNRDSFLKDLDRLVRIPSISQAGEGGFPFGEACKDVLDEITAIGRNYGFVIENHEYYCGSCLMPGTLQKPKRIGLFAHLDVVPLGEGWQYPPLRCTQVGEVLVGRGVGDNKGPAICALYAMRFLKEQGISLSNDVLLYFGLSEETGMQDVTYFCETQQIPDISLVTDTNFPVCYGEKGLLRFQIARKASGNLQSFQAGSVVNVIPAKGEAVLSGVSLEVVTSKLGSRPGLDFTIWEDNVKIIANGISAHAAFPTGAVNAIQVLSKALAESGLLTGDSQSLMEAVAKMTGDFYGEGTAIACEDEASGPLTCVGSVAHLEGDECFLSFDIRYPVTESGQKISEIFEKQIRDLGFSVIESEISPPAYVPLNHPVLTALCQVCDQVLGKHYEPYTMGGGTYARHLPFAVGFGPGVPDTLSPFDAGHGQGHQPDECIPFEVLLNGVAVYIAALIQLDKIL